jgi:flavodoxin
MMKALVTYMSKTGNTKKVAEAIFDELACEKEIRPIEDVEDIGSYDLSFLGFPTHRFGPDEKSMELLAKYCRDGRKVALFVTHCSPEDAKELPQWMDKFKDAAAGADVVGFFDCQGQLAKSVEMVLRMSPNKEYRYFAKNHHSYGQPDETRLLRAREFARDTLNHFSMFL